VIQFDLVWGLIECVSWKARNKDKSTVIGLDFGTTNTIAEKGRSGKHENIEKNGFPKSVPSIVGFMREGVIVGEEAKEQMSKNPENTIFGLHRHLGLRFSDATVQKAIKLVPYKVVNIKNGAYVQPTLPTQKPFYSHEDIGEEIVRVVTENPEDDPDPTIGNVVLAVPSYFKSEQIKATLQIGNQFGFKHFYVITVSEAASLGHGLQTKENKNIVVLHLGAALRTFLFRKLKISNSQRCQCFRYSPWW
jgi:molecular chaperone DnaK